MKNAETFHSILLKKIIEDSKTPFRQEKQEALVFQKTEKIKYDLFYHVNAPTIKLQLFSLTSYPVNKKNLKNELTNRKGSESPSTVDLNPQTIDLKNLSPWAQQKINYWSQILKLKLTESSLSIQSYKSLYRSLAKALHPDTGENLEGICLYSFSEFKKDANQVEKEILSQLKK